MQTTLAHLMEGERLFGFCQSKLRMVECFDLDARQWTLTSDRVVEDEARGLCGLVAGSLEIWQKLTDGSGLIAAGKSGAASRR